MLITRWKREKPREIRIRVALLGAGFISQGLANHIVNTKAGMRLVGVYNRRAQRAFDLCMYAGVKDAIAPVTPKETDIAIREGKVVVTDDAFLLARSTGVDVIVDVTGSVEFGTRVALEAFRNQKDVVLLNAEIDATMGPILQVYAQKHGVILSACEGDEPGLQINLYRWVKGLGLTPRVIGNIKGLQDPYRNPTTQKGFAEKWGQNPAMVTSFADGSKINFEQSIVANATGFFVRSRGMSRGMEYKDDVMKIGKISTTSKRHADWAALSITSLERLSRKFMCLRNTPIRSSSIISAFTRWVTVRSTRSSFLIIWCILRCRQRSPVWLYSGMR